MLYTILPKNLKHLATSEQQTLGQQKSPWNGQDQKLLQRAAWATQ